MSIQREWPGNLCDCQDEENFQVHEYLCDILENEMKYSEDEVCTASVGIWGAIHLMRQKLDVERNTVAMQKIIIQNLKELSDRQSRMIKELSK